MDERIFANKSLWQLWTWLLMKANHSDKEWALVTKGSGEIEVQVNRGQLVFGRVSAAKELNDKPTTVWKRLQKLKTLGFCDIQSNKNYSLVTICNYEEMFASAESKVTSESERTVKERSKNGERTVKERDTTKNEKNLKECKEGKTFCPNSNEFRLANLLFNLILERNPGHKKPNIQSWAKAFDLLLRVDKRPLAEAEAVLRWSQADPFWQTNILSADKFRKQYDALKVRQRSNWNGAKPTKPQKSRIDEINETLEEFVNG